MISLAHLSSTIAYWFIKAKSKHEIRTVSFLDDRDFRAFEL
jgi:hypothetical protein